MIGLVEGDEALGVLGRDEDGTSVVDGDGLVERRVEDQERLAQAGDTLGQALTLDILQELLLDAEGPAGEQHLGLAGPFDLVPRAGEVVCHMGRVGRGTDGRHRLGVGDVAGGSQHSSATQAVADQDGGGAVVVPEVVRGGHQVGNVGGEVGVGELALAMAQAGEVEAQHGNAVARQTLGDAGGGEDVLRAGEAVGEERIGADGPLRPIEPRGELAAVAAWKSDLLAA